MDIGRYLDNIGKKFTRKETTKMKQYDYLIVGSGLYGAVFAQQATANGSTNDQTLQEMYIQKILRRSMYINMEHISSIQTIKKYGITLQSLQSLIDSQTHQLQITKENYILFHLICTHSIRCGEL